MEPWTFNIFNNIKIDFISNASSCNQHSWFIEGKNGFSYWKTILEKCPSWVKNLRKKLINSSPKSWIQESIVGCKCGEARKKNEILNDFLVLVFNFYLLFSAYNVSPALNNFIYPGIYCLVPIMSRLPRTTLSTRVNDRWAVCPPPS